MPSQSRVEPLAEGAIARMREHLRLGKAFETVRDGESVWAWTQQALEHLEDLLEQVEVATATEGGTLARRIREALETRILRELHGRAALTDDTAIESLSVHVLPGGVLVDVRLKIGTWKQ